MASCRRSIGILHVLRHDLLFGHINSNANQMNFILRRDQRFGRVHARYTQFAVGMAHAEHRVDLR